MSATQLKPSYQEALEAQRVALKDQLSRVWSQEELSRLQTLLSSKDYSLYLAHLLRLEKALQAAVWKAKSYDEFRYVQGQMDTLVRILRIPEEVNLAKEMYNARRTDDTPDDTDDD